MRRLLDGIDVGLAHRKGEVIALEMIVDEQDGIALVEQMGSYAIVGATG